MTDHTSTETQSHRRDPIRERYYRAVELAELISQVLFYASATFSFAVLLIERNSSVYNLAHIAFILAVTALFAVGIGLRLYWIPAATDARSLDLISNAYAIPLTHEKTELYYNNNESDPIRRLGVALMENSFFSREISRAMLPFVRTKLLVYLVLLIGAWTYRNTDYGLLETAAQAIFSEYLLSHWLRLEWFRSRCNNCYKSLYSLFQSSPPKLKLHAQIISWHSYYDTTKANAGVTLSARVFTKMNPFLTREWNEVKAGLTL